MGSGNHLVDNNEAYLDAPEEKEVFCDVCVRYKDECLCMTFEDYLIKVFTDQYRGGKDYFEDDLDAWMGMLDVDDIKKYAEGFGAFMLRRGMENNGGR